MLKDRVKLMLEDNFNAQASDIFIASLIDVIQGDKFIAKEFVLRRVDLQEEKEEFDTII